MFPFYPLSYIFRPGAGNQHLHWYFNFTGCIVETVPKSLRLSGCVGLALMAAMVISSLVGTLVPMLFHKIKIDPAVASGPLITTVNDLVAVIAYYGLVWILLIDVLHLA